MKDPEIIAGLCSTDTLRRIAAECKEPYMLLNIDSRSQTDVTPAELERMVNRMEATGAVMLYTDYSADGKPMPCIDYQPGSIRDDFGFGPLVLLRSNAFIKAVESQQHPYRHAAWYDLRLRLSRMGNIEHLSETLYRSTQSDNRSADVTQFDYVDPRNAAVQAEMEQACTDHLRAIGAYLRPDCYNAVDYGDGFPVEASVVIPVRNRCATIADAVKSALAQRSDFPFNVIVVDNHSTDGTSERLKELAAENDKLIVITPAEENHGIGGCWNIAIANPACGRFAVQLDSDDLYSSPDTLSRIVAMFHTRRCALVIGSYTLTDFNLAPIPPGKISHSEWTDANGRNNALRINGFGAPRAYATTIARQMPMPDVSYGEDYAMCLQLSRLYPVGRIYDSLYLCRRWGGNSDSGLTIERLNANNTFKDTVRTREIEARSAILSDSNA